MTNGKQETIAILTIYTPQEALYYFMDEWEKDPDTATVIKRIKYDKPPVVRLKPKEDKAWGLNELENLCQVNKESERYC